MYPVAAPANSCDQNSTSKSSRRPEKAPKCDLKIVGGGQSNKDFQESLRSIDPSELAAKILQLHANANEKATLEKQAPKLVDEPDDKQFDIPNVLRKQDGSERLADVVRQSQEAKESRKARANTDSSGPSFKFLLAITLSIGLAGGAAMALGIPDMLKSENTDLRPVATERIVAVPEIDRSSNTQSDGEALPVSVNEDNMAGGSTLTAEPAQIAKAKDRIRAAFAAGGASAPSSSPTLTSGRNSLTDQPSFLAPAVSENAALADTTLPERADYPVLASNSPAAVLPEKAIDPASSPGVADTSQSTVAPLASTDTSGENANRSESSPLPTENTDASTSFPNAARTLASVNMRVSEEKNGRILAVIPSGTQVKYGTCGTWWCSVEHDGKTGFIGQRYLERSAQAQ
ncbi:SH3 domain-containing protein [uncultured Roseibium sp.]|uniref:SH3 domain-containing protein n=1 Tax=uncultured Roseibium sp. TaxID=1936171 RepID=UPI002625004E|nr:SH3 domain-containing protein [uncultured Roseibium sp.]